MTRSGRSVAELAAQVRAFEPAPPPDLALSFAAPPCRLAYAAAHVVDRPEARRAGKPILDQIDWEGTLAFRRYLWSLGLGVAEAMDTAQRNQIGWEAAHELIDRTLAAARDPANPAPWPETMCGAGGDGLAGDDVTLAQLIDEYVRQGTFIQERGGTVILLATPILPKRFPDPESYLELYREVSRQLKPPLFVHWLGEMFAPALRGYFPGESFWQVMEQNAGRIKGVKISLLDEALELEARRRLRENGQIVLTGDDFNYASLILGDGSTGGAPKLAVRGREFPTGDFSHALLGVFDAIAPVAAKALERLSLGDAAGYSALMNPTQALGLHLFQPPTHLYKAGVVFLACLNGHQERFSLIGDMHLEREAEHYVEAFRLAAACGALRDPAEAKARLLRWLDGVS